MTFPDVMAFRINEKGAMLMRGAMRFKTCYDIADSAINRFICLFLVI